MTFPRLSSLTALCLTLATPALAEVTVQDVLANRAALFEAFGGVERHDVTLIGPNAEVSGGLVTFELPLGIGALTMTTPPMTLAGDAQGVAISYPDTYTLTFDATIQGGLAGQLTLAVAAPGYVTTATGTPGAITYRTEQPSLSYELTNLTTTSGEFEAILKAATLQSTAVTVEYKVIEGDPLIFESTTTAEQSTSVYTIFDPVLSTDATVETTYYGVVQGGRYAIPTETSLMNLAPALRDGLLLESTFAIEAATGTFTLRDGDSFVKDMATVDYGYNDTEISLTREGLGYYAVGEDLNFVFFDPSVPIPVALTLSSLDMSLMMPVLKSDVAQPLLIDLEVSGIVFRDDFWDLFDPSRTLDRSPLSIAYASRTDIVWAVELLDLLTNRDQMQNTRQPALMEATTLTAAISALGASGDLSGGFTFDNDDLNSIPGLPRPEGSMTLNLSGVHALLDDFLEAGLLPAGQASSVRLALGLYFRSTEEDAFTSEIEFHQNGHIFINDQRFQ